MNINNKIYDNSLNNDDSPQTELVEVNFNIFINKNNNYYKINNNEITSSTECEENYDKDEDFNRLKEQFNNSEIIDKNFEHKNQKSLKYRKGNLNIIYNKKGKPLIVLGPDCKFFINWIFHYLFREIFFSIANIYILFFFNILFKILEIFNYLWKNFWAYYLFII